MRRSRALPRLLAVLALTVCSAGIVRIAGAREVTIPLTLDTELIRQALLAQVFAGPDHTATAWDDGSGCNRLVLAEPRVGSQDGRIRIEMRGDAIAGFPLLQICMFGFEWEGIVEVLEEPELQPGGRAVRFRVVDSRLLDRDGEEEMATGVLWGWVKDYVHPQLAAVTIDLDPAVRELGELLPLFLPREDAERTRRLLDSVRIAAVTATESGLRLDVRFELEDAPTASPAATSEPEPPLTQAEIAAFVAALHELDSFLTFVVKVSGAETQVAEIRSALLEVLLEERYDLIEALASPRRDTRDPVRELFLATWDRLAPVIRRLAPTLPASVALRFLSFVSAGDALRALDEVGPAAGLDISADGLRRLAHILAPRAPGDPLAYELGVDPQLRELFGFGAPLPAPEDNPDVATDGAATGIEGAADATAGAADVAATPAAAATPAPDTPAPPQPTTSPEAARTPEAAPSSAAPVSPGETPLPQAGAHLPPPGDLLVRGGTWLELLARLAVPEASAAAEPPAIAEDVVKRLNRWAPGRDDLDEYLPLVRDLLAAVAAERLREDALDARFRPMFRTLVPATAWQESCWRQFVRRGGKLVPMRSPLGSIGIMQVNQSVWRGFYDLAGLRNDIRYNARAGAEILIRYMRQYVVRGAASSASDTEVAAWAYAVYNGGPGQLARFRKGKMGRRERAVDSGFREKFEKTSKDALAVRECFVE